MCGLKSVDRCCGCLEAVGRRCWVYNVLALGQGQTDLPPTGCDALSGDFWPAMGLAPTFMLCGVLSACSSLQGLLLELHLRIQCGHALGFHFSAVGSSPDIGVVRMRMALVVIIGGGVVMSAKLDVPALGVKNAG